MKKRAESEREGLARRRSCQSAFVLLLWLFSIPSGSAPSSTHLLPAAAEMAQGNSGQVQVKVSISGIWESNIGWRYDIKQKGSNFTWVVINRSQTAVGTIAANNKDIQATWNDDGSKGTAKGSILETDETGKATFIEWDNGVFFHRK